MRSYAWIGDLVILIFAFACWNAYRVTPEYANYIGIFGTIVLLLWYLRNLLSEGYSMPAGIYFFTRLGLPLVTVAMAFIGYYWFPPKKKKADPPPFEKVDCRTIRYGTFIVNDKETIQRVNVSGKDYEIHGRDSFEIEWTDCSYAIQYSDNSFEIVTITAVFGKDAMAKATDGFMHKRFFVLRKVD
jgi:hypothetical protein